MNTNRTALSAVALGVVLCACTVKLGAAAATTPTTTSTTTTTTTSTTTTTVYDPYQKYLTDIHSYTAFVEATGFSSEQVIGFGDMVCNYFRDDGNSDGLIQLLYEVGTKNSMDQDQLNALAAAAGVAVNDICPQYSGR